MGTVVIGKARFYEGMNNMPDGFRPGKVPGAGSAYANDKDPKLPTDNATDEVARPPWTLRTLKPAAAK